ncbi:hypothetical protein DYU05_17820 [Mucilaginibacter terrenus]|uniref:DUF695 domain-containing protein n=1 Tax=Mucilaginibacter terrenus TaxID=2482727 RepID=A0A3E2NL73_9SPHI|nr:hypothetical protein [Mucilaginibacter terrenus]RFZ81683.1 hypothetical protein DYU05_17820 [Mucilaginibacter terrenus]
MFKEKQFWDWFKENEAKYFFLNQINDDDEKERLLDIFLSHLHEYCDHLFFEVGGHPHEKQDLIITADGDTDFFDLVETLVKQAPVLEYWNVIAFKPAREDFTVGYNGIELNPKDMWFIPLNSKNSQKIGLKILIENYASSNKEDFLTASYLVLDNMLGEKSNAQDIGYVEIENLPSFPEREELIELVKLSRYIKWKKSKNS